jgi:hypothetical protein
MTTTKGLLTEKGYFDSWFHRFQSTLNPILLDLWLGATPRAKAFSKAKLLTLYLVSKKNEIGVWGTLFHFRACPQDLMTCH